MGDLMTQRVSDSPRLAQTAPSASAPTPQTLRTQSPWQLPSELGGPVPG